MLRYNSRSTMANPKMDFPPKDAEIKNNNCDGAG